MHITALSGIIPTVIGTLTSAVNGIKAHATKEKIKNAIDEEEELFEVVNLELEKEKEKNKIQEEEITKLKEKTTKKSTRKSKINENTVQNELKEENLILLEEDKQKIKK